jgi:1-phosphofructokinase
MISTVTLNPALDKCIYVDKLHANDTNRIIRMETDAGGKGLNASRVLKQLGNETTALGFVGGHTGKYIEHALSSSGICVDFVHTDTNTRTNMCIQEACGAPPTTLNEPGPQVTEEQFEDLYSKVRDAASKSSMVICGGSLPPGAPPDTYRRLVKEISEAGSEAILDSDGEAMRLGIEAAPFMIKPNRDEVRRLGSSW